MKNKLVLWVNSGTEEAPTRVLLAYQLRPTENKYDLWRFTEEVAGDELSAKLLNEWRNGENVDLSAAYQHEQHELTAAGSLLPSDCKMERDELLQRAKTEWMFTVLSHKLYSSYQQEVQDFRDKLSKAGSYSKEIFEDLKNFWVRVQDQVRDRSIFRSQADSLKTDINEMFDQLKALRNAEERAFETEAKAGYERLNSVLTSIETRLQEGRGDLFRIFNDLKGLQSEYHNTKLPRNFRNEIWDRIDSAFKKAKSIRFGENPAGAAAGAERGDKRLLGLKDAMDKLQESVTRDEKDLEMMQSRIASGKASQLEVQLREAKLALVKERIRSKQEKIADMVKTYDDLVRRNEKARQEAEKARVLAEAKAKVEAAKKAEAKEHDDQAREKMEKAMAVIVKEKQREEENPKPVKKKKVASAKPSPDDVPADEENAAPPAEAVVEANVEQPAAPEVEAPEAPTTEEVKEYEAPVVEAAAEEQAPEAPSAESPEA